MLCGSCGHPSTDRKRSRTSDTEPLALVTGASGGVGLEPAEQLAERGYDLVVNAEDDTRLQQAARRARAAGARVEAVRADLRDPGETERLFAEATGLGRPLDVVVLNACVGRGGALVGTDLADEREVIDLAGEREVIDLDVRSTVHLAKLVLRDTAARDEGRVLVTSSVASTTPGSFQAVYNASKSFLRSFTKTQAAVGKLPFARVRTDGRREVSRPSSGVTRTGRQPPPGPEPSADGPNDRYRARGTTCPHRRTARSSWPTRDRRVCA
ncbi:MULTISPECIES: SDR family NAD(P)-dependent oxidoreductase [unclassified Streptomyces]|uniref:SDR family NAD(P)-dependent oxidoreductase n=1 Tax=unclassified Streptomyces TaxID=2593676 RepID=UPI0035E2C19B